MKKNIEKNKIIFWILGIVFFVLFLYLFSNGANVVEEEIVTSEVEIKTISVDLWNEIYINERNNDDYVVLDVRTAAEFNEGNIGGAVNVDFYGTDFEEKLGMLDREKKYLIYCRSGSRSGSALNEMKKLGFETVYDLDGGYNAWKSKFGDDLKNE